MPVVLSLIERMGGARRPQIRCRCRLGLLLPEIPVQWPPIMRHRPLRWHRAMRREIPCWSSRARLLAMLGVVHEELCRYARHGRCRGKSCRRNGPHQRSSGGCRLARCTATWFPVAITIIFEKWRLGVAFLRVRTSLHKRGGVHWHSCCKRSRYSSPSS